MMFVFLLILGIVVLIGVWIVVIVSDDKLLCELQERLVAELVAFDNGRSGLSAEYCERLAAVVDAIHDVKELW
jgi:hypothetical protein